MASLPGPGGRPDAAEAHTPESGATPAIAVEGISKSFGGTPVLDRIDLIVARGEFVSLLGPSGCGKTTLLRIIGGFETQSAGTVRIQGELVDGRPPNKRPVNMVFQRYALFPHRTVGQNIAFPLELRGVKKDERRRRVSKALDLVRLPSIADRLPAQLSGGQAQRVAVARALVSEPEVLLLDEPLGALDLKLRKHMQLELRRIHEELGTTFVYVTHDQEEALTMSDRVVLMNEGRIVQEGTPVEIYEQPNSLFSSSFVGEINLLPGHVVRVAESCTVVEVLGAEIVCSGNELSRGEQVTVGVRPESLAVGVEGATAENALSGVVQRVVFLGNIVHIHVDLGSETSVVAERPRGRGMPSPGDSVVTHWSASSSIMLRGAVSDDLIRALASGDEVPA